MSVTEYDVTGMSCEHCERAIEAEVRQLPGVQQVDVSASTGHLVVTSDAPLADSLVLAAVDEAGYAAAPC
jgi:copper chaperone